MPNCGENYPGNIEYHHHKYITPKEVIEERKSIGRTLEYILDMCARDYCFKNASLDEFAKKLRAGKFGAEDD